MRNSAGREGVGNQNPIAHTAAQDVVLSDTPSSNLQIVIFDDVELLSYANTTGIRKRPGVRRVSRKPIAPLLVPHRKIIKTEPRIKGPSSFLTSEFSSTLTAELHFTLHKE